MMKKGRMERPNWLISGFRKAIQDKGLDDIPMKGYSFTWFKSLSTKRAIEEKLDRANKNWCVLYPDAKVKTLTVTSYDHYPFFFVVM